MHAKAAQRQIFSFALAAMFLAAQVSSFTHELLVQHVTCAEHGELIHVDGSVAPAALPPLETSALTSALPGLTTGHGHEHCLACTARREQLILSGPSATLPGPVASKAVVGVARGSFSPLPVALLRLAPKNSPPA